MAENHKKIVLTVKKLLKLLERFENRELASELAKNYVHGTMLPG
jgi:hypothetical protein